jgi:hypothetical protein
MNRETSRNESFDENEPFNNDPSLNFQQATGSFSFLNPTRALFSYVPHLLPFLKEPPPDPSPSPEPQECPYCPEATEPDTQEQPYDLTKTATREQTHESADSAGRQFFQAPESLQQQQQPSVEAAHPATHDLSLQPTETTDHSTVLSPARSTKPEELPELAEPSQTQERAHVFSSGAISFLWRSRDNRKGRHALLIRPFRAGKERDLLPPRTNSLSSTRKGFRAMATTYPYWDISWLIAMIFVLGSVLWIIDGFFGWLPLVRPDTEFSDEEYAGGWITFIGSTVFLVASMLLMVEAVNVNQTGCFAWAIERVVKYGDTRMRACPDRCQHHHHRNRENAIGQNCDERCERDWDTFALSKAPPDREHYTWQWVPSWSDFRNHYLYELGFLACSIQLFSASLYWVSRILALPQISEQMSSQALNGAYWAPGVVGGIGFTFASVLLMLECQPRWWIPAPGVLGWHIGLWKGIGSVGFTLTSALGPASDLSQGALFQSRLATFWGSWAILIGSLIQWYESLEKHPVVEEGRHSWSEFQGSDSKGDDAERNESLTRS